jgi:dCMP deaminase
LCYTEENKKHENNFKKEGVGMSILKKVVELANSIPLGERDDWNQYFMAKAYMASLRSTCGSRRVGAVIVRDNREIASGYNGYPSGAKHCIDGGCPRFKARQEGVLESGQYSKNYECHAFHAEHNALNQCLKEGVSTTNTIIYTTTFPCRECAKKILGAGITKLYYLEGYPDEYSEGYLNQYGIKAVQVQI